MQPLPRLIGLLLLVAPVGGALAADAVAPAALLEQWRIEAAASEPFSAARGRELFGRRVTEWSCSSCHTADPRKPGKHAVTDKPIQPLAPSANPKRFAERAKVEKWFRRNCKDTFQRPCTPAEKGDLLAYLLSLK